MSRAELDLLGVGFGPANLALALAVDELPPDDRLDVLFCERQPRFGWHRGMLLPGATLQVSFLKDLVTQRNPASPASFVAYLHERGRLADFVNAKTFYPTRLEFHDYLEWAAARVAGNVRYGTTITALRPVREDGAVRALEAQLPDGTRVRARDVALATGLRPRLPREVRPGPRVWHNHTLLEDLRALDEAHAAGAPGPRSFVVLGAGQSAAEVVQHLHTRYPTAAVHSVFRSFGYAPADDSPFANRVFDPGAVDEFHTAPPAVRDDLLRRHATTNYSVVDLDLIQELYRTEYAEAVAGARRLHVHRASELLEVREEESAVGVDVLERTSGAVRRLRADVLVCATGFEHLDPTALLGELAPAVRRDAAGRVLVHRDHRLVTDPDVTCGIHLMGGTEHSHGLSSSLLSNVAPRAGEVLASVRRRRRAPETARAGGLPV
ncbi:lysine N(6)-hydroxylase/L-ornithine N(5)-oxygenase family protein [Kineococcus sp. SYSU DK018]|uniref:lysine N(6)-hydroxylase/L-ornithine N(5)-oxygenase family protein n=1 Tax=Kineococcus sp. SYSU DK018 TaxID=3383139 RepID=UPI003D7D8940